MFTFFSIQEKGEKKELILPRTTSSFLFFFLFRLFLQMIIDVELSSLSQVVLGPLFVSNSPLDSCSTEMQVSNSKQTSVFPPFSCKWVGSGTAGACERERGIVKTPRIFMIYNVCITDSAAATKTVNSLSWRRERKREVNEVFPFFLSFPPSGKLIFKPGSWIADVWPALIQKTKNKKQKTKKKHYLMPGCFKNNQMCVCVWADSISARVRCFFACCSNGACSKKMFLVTSSFFPRVRQVGNSSI